MKVPSAVELLNVWEDGADCASARRGLLLLKAIFPGASPDALAALSIGRRDAELLRLREALRGPRMAAFAVCPACRERLELTLDTRELLSLEGRGGTEIETGAISLALGNCSVAFRLPTTQDVLAAEAAEDVNGAESLILDRCLLSAEKNGAPVSALELPAEVVSGIAELMAEADPLADIRLNIRCPACEHTWRAELDIVSFLWTEIEVWARRILSEVHTLARAYGWREADILALSARRRQVYLEMTGLETVRA
jgi:hypothetical protein